MPSQYEEELKQRIRKMESEISQIQRTSLLDEKGFKRTISSKERTKEALYTAQQGLTEVANSWVAWFGALCVIGPSMGEYKLFNRNLDENGNRKFGSDFGPDGQPEPPGKGVIANGLVSMGYQNVIWLFIATLRGMGLTMSIYEMFKMRNIIKKLKENYVRDLKVAFKDAKTKFFTEHREKRQREGFTKEQIDQEISQIEKKMDEHLEREIRGLDSVIDSENDKMKAKLTENQLRMEKLKEELDVVKASADPDKRNEIVQEISRLAEENFRMNMVLSGTAAGVEDSKRAVRSSNYLTNALRNRMVYNTFDLLRTIPDIAGRVIMTRPVWGLDHIPWGYAQGVYIWFWGEALFALYRVCHGAIQWLRDKADRRIDRRIFERLFNKGKLTQKVHNGEKFVDVLEGAISPELKQKLEVYTGTERAFNFKVLNIKTIGLLYKEAMFPKGKGYSAVRDDQVPGNLLSKEHIAAFEAVGSAVLTDRQRELIKEVIDKIFNGNPSESEVKAKIERLMKYVICNTEEERMSLTVSPKSVNDLYLLLQDLKKMEVRVPKLKAEDEEALRVALFKIRYNQVRENLKGIHSKDKFGKLKSIYNFFRGKSRNYEKYINIKTLAKMKNDPDFELYVRYVKGIEGISSADRGRNNSYMDLYREYQSQLKGLYRRANINESRKFKKLAAERFASDTVDLIYDSIPDGEARFEVLREKVGDGREALESRARKLERVLERERRLGVAAINLRAIGHITGKHSRMFDLVTRISDIKKGHDGDGFSRSRFTDECLSVERRAVLLRGEKKGLRREILRAEV